MIVPYGPLVNGGAIVVGGLVGLLLGSRLPERVRTLVFQGIGLCVLIIGVKMALTTQNPLILIFSVLLGAVAGGLLDLESLFMRAGDLLKSRIRSSNPKFTEGMVNASVLFCIGAMAILGSFDEGLRGDRTIVFSKAIIDGFVAMAMSSAFGVGVLFAAIPVFLYQGILTVGAEFITPWLTAPVMTELTATGGILIMGIGFNLMDVTHIQLSNLIPALLVVVILAICFI